MAVEASSTWAVALATVSTLAAGLYLVVALYQHIAGRKRGRLPPGPLLHFPIFGDGVYLSRGNPLLFFFNRFKRYGSVYRTKMLGSRVYVVNDMAALQGVLNDKGGRLEIPFRGFKMLMGESFLNHAGIHGPWRKVLLAALAPPQLAALVPRVVGVMRSHLEGWEAAGRVPIYRAARLMGVDLGVDVILQVQLPEGVDRTWVKQQVEVFLDGLYVLPLDLPGTPLRRAIAARDRLAAVFEPGVAQGHAEFREQWAAAGKSINTFAEALLHQGQGQGQASRVKRGEARAEQEQPQQGQGQQQQHQEQQQGQQGQERGGRGSSGRGQEKTDKEREEEGEGEADGGGGGRATSGLRPTIMGAQWMGRAAAGRCALHDAALAVCQTLVAAADTTRFALFNTWSLLAMSPRVQDRLHQEQQQVISQYGSDLSYQAACNMSYMDATLKECMRLLPASAGGIRRLTADLRVGEYVIPKGEAVWYHAGLLHATDPALWDGNTDCEVPLHMDWRRNFEAAFRPERWLAGGGKEGGRPRHFYTFGTGIHLCVGMNLVNLEIKLLLALVLRKYRLQLETPDMLRRCGRLFPFLVPEKGTDNVLLLPREAPAQAA